MRVVDVHDGLCRCVSAHAYECTRGLFMSLGRWMYVAFVLVLGYCVNICLETFDVTGVTNVATNALVGNLPAGVCDYVRSSAPLPTLPPTLLFIH